MTTSVWNYDKDNRLLGQSGAIGLQPILTLVDTYDAASNRLIRTNNGNATSWNYDNNYRLIGQSGAIGTATFAYDSMNNVLVKWHLNGAPMSMTHDAASRLVTMVQGLCVRRR